MIKGNKPESLISSDKDSGSLVIVPSESSFERGSQALYHLEESQLNVKAEIQLSFLGILGVTGSSGGNARRSLFLLVYRLTPTVGQSIPANEG